MADEITPAPEQLPSSPRSPHPKRIKKEEPPHLTVASMLNDAQPTPTPDTANMANPMATAIAPVPTPARAPQPPRESQNHYDTTPVPIPAATLRNGTPQLQVQLLSSAATAPTKGSAFAAGHDIYASKDTTIPARGRAMVDTDIAMAIPDYSYGRVAPRSGLAVKHGINVGAGVIDQDYRGQVKVLLFNMSDEDFAVKKGDRIAQIIMEMILHPEVTVVDTLPDTVRGAGGFGSTGGFGPGQVPGTGGMVAPTLPGAPSGPAA